MLYVPKSTTQKIVKHLSTMPPCGDGGSRTLVLISLFKELKNEFLWQIYQ